MAITSEGGTGNWVEGNFIGTHLDGLRLSENLWGYRLFAGIPVLSFLVKSVCSQSVTSVGQRRSTAVEKNRTQLTFTLA